MSGGWWGRLFGHHHNEHSDHVAPHSQENTMENRDARAIKVLTEARWVVLGTVDADGPWTAAVAHTYVPNTGFYTISAIDSRHGKAIARNGVVSGVLCDSAIDPAEVESIQFVGHAVQISDDVAELQRLISLAHPELTPDKVKEDAMKIASDPGKALYYVAFKEMYVLDQEGWKATGIDSRLEVDTASVLGLFGASRK